MKLKKILSKNDKLSTRIIFSLTLVVFLGLILFSINVTKTMAQSELKQFEKTTKNITEYIYNEVNDLGFVASQINDFYEQTLLYTTTKEQEQELIEDGLIQYSNSCEGIFLLKNPNDQKEYVYYSLSQNTHDHSNTLKESQDNIDLSALLTQYEVRPKEEDTPFLYFDTKANQLFAVKELFSWRNDKNVLLGVGLDSEFMNSYFQDIALYNHANAGIATENGYIIAHTNRDLIGSSLESLSLEEDVLAEIQDSLEESKAMEQRFEHNLYDVELYQKGDHLLIYMPIRVELLHSDLGIMFDIPFQALQGTAMKLVKNIFLWGLITVIVINILIKFVVTRALKPIDNIVSVMHAVRTGDFKKRTKIKSCTEMEVIGTGLNHLLDDIVEDREQLIQQKKEISDLLNEIETLMQENDRIYYETIKSLAKTIDAKDPYTGGHCDRVSKYSLLMGKRAGLSDEQLTSLAYGAMLHDIGKIAISEAIISKEGKLTDEEYLQIKTHPQKGYDIIKNIHFLKEARLGVLYHHERYDGKGYPYGIQGEKIPIIARIIALSDSYDAITTNRSYRKALSVDDAILEIQNNSGGQFDPKLAKYLIEIIEEEQAKELYK